MRSLSEQQSAVSDAGERLRRCVRDLAAVQAIPSMCIGRSFAEALQICFEALPTALSADLIYLEIPARPPAERAWLRGREAGPEQVQALKRAFADDGGGGPRALPRYEEFDCFEAEVPVGTGHGRLFVGRRTQLNPTTDRLLIRCAANLVGTTLETANVLEDARRRDEFMAMLGHELRNPLAPILTAVDLLARHPEVAREREVIDRNTRHLARLVDDLLDISRVTRGDLVLRREEVSLSSILERAIEVAIPLLTRLRHDLNVGDCRGIVLEADQVRLVQVFGNLLTNAAKFTPPGGRIDVSIQELVGRVRVSVRDTGRGLASEDLQRVFLPFVQVDRERDAQRGGLGLGLAIVHDLLKRHGGSISAHSDGPGRGTTFVVELPTVSVQPRAAAAPPVKVAHKSREAFRVLVVDDNSDVAFLLAEALQEEGFQTAVEYDGRAALEAWQRFSPHVGIFDVGMPGLDGYELARLIRAQHGPAPVLIAATGYGLPDDRTRAAASGFNTHLVKPVSLDVLIDLLDQHVVAGANADQRR